MTLPAIIVWRGLQLTWQEVGTPHYATARLPFTAVVRPKGQGWLARIILAGAHPAEQLGNSPTEALDAAVEWWEQELAAIPRAGARVYADTQPSTLGEQFDPLVDSQVPEDS